MQEQRKTWFWKRKITHKGIKFGATAAYFAFLLVAQHYAFPCLFQKYLGIPCMGCGMTHAYRSLLHLDFVGAFQHHPMFWAVPILYLYILYDGRLFPNEKADKALLFALLLGFLISYILKLIFWFS